MEIERAQSPTHRNLRSPNAAAAGGPTAGRLPHLPRQPEMRASCQKVVHTSVAVPPRPTAVQPRSIRPEGGQKEEARFYASVSAPSSDAFSSLLHGF